MKVSELKDEKLDYWVARANGKIHDKEVVIAAGMVQVLYHIDREGNELFERYSPSTNWMKGGPLVEKMKMDFNYMGGGEYEAHVHPARISRGPTMLIAGMRCYVSEHFGDEVDDC